MTTAKAATTATETTIQMPVRLRSVINVATGSGLYFSLDFFFATVFHLAIHYTRRGDYNLTSVTNSRRPVSGRSVMYSV